MCSPPLSSVDIDPPRIGYEAARLLDLLIKGGKPPTEPVLVPPREVVARQSSDIIAIEDADVTVASGWRGEQLAQRPRPSVAVPLPDLL